MEESNEKLKRILAEYGYDKNGKYHPDKDLDTVESNRDWIDYYRQRVSLGNNNWMKKRIPNAQ